jgi:hypothetical protein
MDRGLRFLDLEEYIPHFSGFLVISCLVLFDFIGIRENFQCRSPRNMQEFGAIDGSVATDKYLLLIDSGHLSPSKFRPAIQAQVWLNGPGLAATFEIATRLWVRILRLRQTGLNHRGENAFGFQAFEIVGLLYHGSR